MKSKATSSQRLALLRESLGLSYMKFSEPLGVSHTTAMRWETGASELTRLVALNVANCYGISADWLLTGEGEMMLSHTASIDPSNTTMIPLFPLYPAAGHGTDIVTDPEPSMHLPFDTVWLNQRIGIPSRHLFLTEIVGDSMVPTLSPNDLILVDRSAMDFGFKDGIWVFRLDTAIHVKRVQHIGQRKFIATSDNPVYRPIELEDDFHFIGRMVKMAWQNKDW